MPKRRSHKEINQELFFQDGKAVLFYLMDDRSPMTLTEEQVALSEKDVEELTRRIEDHGGEVCDDMEDARVIIVNEEAIEKYQRFYRFEPDKDVEPPSFVRECIDKNEYRHLREMPVRLGFQPPAKPRRDFTAAEDRFLAEYIALRIPEAEAGGRMGNKIYMELVEHAWEFDHGPWVMGRNHTWHSWRERYKKKPEVFNAMIDLVIKKKGVRTDDKTKYPLDRRRKNRVTQIRLDGSESEVEAEESDAEVGQDEADYQPRGRKRRARSSVHSNASSRPPRKRARVEVQTQDDSEEEDEYLGFELEPDAVYGTAPSPSFSRQVSPEIPEAGPSTAVKGNRPRPRPFKSTSTQGTASISSQKTLVNSTQHSARLESSASYKPDSSQEFEEDHMPEPRQLRSRELKTVSQGDVSGPRRSLGARVEVVVPPLRYSRSPAKTRAKQKERNSMPPIATISRSPSKVDDGDDSGVDEQDEDANPEDEEDELVDDSYVVDAAQYGEPDDVPSQEADMDANEEDATQQVEEAAELGSDREEERADEDEEEDSEANHIFDLDPSSDDEEDEVSNLISPVKAKVVDGHSESDFKAQRSLMNAQLDEADSDARSSSPESSPVPKPRRSTRRVGTVQV